MPRNSKRNRQTGTINAFKQDIMRTGDEHHSGGRVYFSKVLKTRVRKDAQGRVIQSIPSITTVRAI